MWPIKRAWVLCDSCWTFVIYRYMRGSQTYRLSNHALHEHERWCKPAVWKTEASDCDWDDEPC